MQFRASYGTEIHYQRLAMESRKAWIAEDEKRGLSTQSDEPNDKRLFVASGMLRVQPTDSLDSLEQETLVSMERDGLRDTQFVKSDPQDCHRAERSGWRDKLLNFEIPDESPPKSYDAVLDSLAGFVRCSNACAHYQRLAAAKGVVFCFGERGMVESLLKVESKIDGDKEKVTGLRTKDGMIHQADTVVVAGKFCAESPPRAKS